jgi:hypothetical protein
MIEISRGAPYPFFYISMNKVYINMNKEFTQRQTQVTILWKLVSLNRLRHLNNSDQTGGERQQYSLARNTGRRITYSYDSTGEGEELEDDASSCSQCSSAKARTVPGLKTDSVTDSESVGVSVQFRCACGTDSDCEPEEAPNKNRRQGRGVLQQIKPKAQQRSANNPRRGENHLAFDSPAGDPE